MIYERFFIYIEWMEILYRHDGIDKIVIIVMMMLVMMMTMMKILRHYKTIQLCI
jgi:hypothetical protein